MATMFLLFLVQTGQKPRSPFISGPPALLDFQKSLKSRLLKLCESAASADFTSATEGFEESEACVVACCLPQPGADDPRGGGM